MKIKSTFTNLLVLGITTGFLASCASKELAKVASELSKSKDSNAKALGSFIQAKREIQEDEEIQMGNEIVGSILGINPLVDNSEVQNYVNELGYWIAMQGERASLPWRFGIMDSLDYNALSAPGGVVLLSKGLVLRCKNESELAAIIGHEIAHVLKKHHLKALQQEAQNLGLKSLSESIQNNNKSNKGIFITGEVLKAGSQIYGKGLDKKDEFEADRMGAILATRAGFSFDGLTSVLHDLKKTSSAESGFSLLFKTHPNASDREKQLMSRFKSKVTTSASLDKSTDRFLMVKGLLN